MISKELTNYFLLFIIYYSLTLGGFVFLLLESVTTLWMEECYYISYRYTLYDI